MVLAYRDDPPFFGVGRLLGVHHQTVQWSRVQLQLPDLGSAIRLTGIPV
jgi:hypothetical protein